MGERREPLLAAGPPVASAADGSEAAGRPVLSPRQARLIGPLGSAVLHLLALFLVLFNWPMPAPVEVAPIPVKLVFEQPPPTPEPRPPEATPPPQGRIASDDLGDVKPKQASPAETATTETPAAPEPSELPEPAPTTTAALPPEPAPAEAEPSAPPQPAAAAALPQPPPKPAAPKEGPAAKPMPKPHPPRKRGEEAMLLASRPAKYPGPAATRDEYLHYLLMLARQHLHLLPRALVGNRRGTTIIGLVVLDNGTITMLHVDRSSGYPDIDHRVAQMLTAVGRGPPLPQWFQGTGMPLQFRLDFPDALEP